MTGEPAAAVHGYVRADPWLEVDVDGPRGTFRGFALGWTGTRVHLTWTEGVGERYLQVLPAERVRRVSA